MPSPDKAVKLVARYNRERAQIERLRERLESKQEESHRTYSAMFNALPPDYRIALVKDGPCYVVDPDGNEVFIRERQPW